MRKIIILLVLIIGCQGLPILPIETVKVEQELIPTLMDGTVALMDEDEVIPYCTGVWIGYEYILTAHHCVAKSLSDFLEEQILGEEQNFSTLQLRDIRYVIKSDIEKDFEKSSIYRKGLVVGLDPENDLALIKADGEVPLHATIPLSNKVRVGDKLHIIGHVQGLAWTYMEGVASAERIREGVTLLQVSAPIYFGVSGGGAFNQYGELVGITSFIYKAPNIGFFVDSKTIKSFLKKYNLSI